MVDMLEYLVKNFEAKIHFAVEVSLTNSGMFANQDNDVLETYSAFG
jgi:hypothetical protein